MLGLATELESWYCEVCAFNVTVCTTAPLLFGASGGQPLARSLAKGPGRNSAQGHDHTSMLFFTFYVTFQVVWPHDPYFFFFFFCGKVYR